MGLEIPPKLGLTRQFDVRIAVTQDDWVGSSCSARVHLGGVWPHSRNLKPQSMPKSWA